MLAGHQYNRFRHGERPESLFAVFARRHADEVSRKRAKDAKEEKNLYQTGRAASTGSPLRQVFQSSASRWTRR